MATTTRSVAGVQMIALSEIRHDQNVRQEILAEEVDALAESIALLGQLTPVSVRPDNENGRYVLIAGHKRYAALAQLGHTEIRAEVRPDGESEAAERAGLSLKTVAWRRLSTQYYLAGGARAPATRTPSLERPPNCLRRGKGEGLDGCASSTLGGGRRPGEAGQSTGDVGDSRSTISGSSFWGSRHFPG
jgi:uncharacterized ParB-like nuclease family protein